jgi:3-phenylpropionate/trans-cinnamate dioxygenase ferredoxin subunit
MSTERLCALDDLTPGSATRVDVAGHRIAVVRIDDDVYAIGDRCSHQNVSLAEGEVHADDHQLECWKHGSAFSLETGEPSSLPATKAVPVYDLIVKDGDVWVELP